MKKRTFLLGAGALAIGGTLAWSRMSTIDLSNLSSRPKLTFPPLLDATQTGRFDLTAIAGQTRFLGDRFTSTWGFNQSYLGPVLRLPQAAVKASVANNLGREVTSHWHGLLLPGDVDGGPHQPISPERYGGQS